jgi:hypothetical protein
VLANAVTALRVQLGDPFAPITVLMPSGPNTVFARTALALQGPFIRVWFDTPEGLAEAQLPPSFWATHRPEPPGWRRPVVRRILNALADAGDLGNAADVVRRPGWLEPLLRALARLEGHGIEASDVATAATAVDDIGDRAIILERVLSALTAARTAEGFATDADVAVAATTAVDDVGVGAATARGVIVVGDRELPRSLHTFTTAWLSRRSVVRVQLPALQHLAPAPWGVVDAVSRAHLDVSVVEMAARPAPALDAVQAGLFTTTATMTNTTTKTATAKGTTSKAADVSIELARTPDDVRECTECVREIRRAIREGTTLDRIAIVMPDGRQRGALEDALVRAHIPATWLVGYPAASLAPARLLTLALTMANGEQTPQRLYELLSHPALALRAALGPDAVAGRGRWRQLLGQIRHARGLERIRQGLERLDLGAEKGASDADLQRAERAAIARASLLTCIDALAEVVGGFAAPATMRAHAQGWSAFLERFARTGESRGRVLQLLLPYGQSSSTNAPVVDVVEATDEWERLGEREVSRGSLTERSIRVLSPLHLMGGSFDLVCVLGLTEKRFPTPAHEDVFIPDALWAALSSSMLQGDSTFPSSSSHIDLERRRFAALVSAARRRLWLSVPRLDFETERPALPSSFVLETLSALHGTRARFSDIEASSVRRGRRAHAWPDNVDDAIDVGEHLVVRSAQASASASASTSSSPLVALSSHPNSRGVLQLHRSMDAVARGGDLDAWTGLVSPSVLPMTGLDGTPVSVSVLASLMAGAADVLFGLLGARSPRWLTTWGDPAAASTLHRRMIELAKQTHLKKKKPGLQDVLQPKLLGELDELATLGAIDDDALDVARPIVATTTHALQEAASEWCAAPPMHRDPIPVDSGLPWRITNLVGRQLTWADDALALVQVASTFRAQNFYKDDPTLALCALALCEQGVALDGVAMLSPDASSKLVNMDKLQDCLSGLRAVTAQVQAGQWSMRTTKRFSLASERRDVANDADAGNGDDQ